MKIVVDVTQADILKAYDHQLGWGIDVRYTPIMFALKRLGIPAVTKAMGHILNEQRKTIAKLSDEATAKEVEFGLSRRRERKEGRENRWAARKYMRGTSSDHDKALVRTDDDDYYMIEPYSFELELSDASTD